MTRRIRRAQRGVLLLIVLALLAMFGMMALSFVLLGSQARLAAETNENAVTQAPSTWKQDMDNAMHIVLRGDTNPREPLWPHSLLESLYGNNTAGPTPVTGVNPISTQITGVSASAAAIPEPERRVGTVLTMLTGQAVTAANGVPQSFRIVGYDATNGMHVLTSGSPINSGEYFFINGVPFSGMGTGFDRTLANVNPTATNFGALLSYADSDSIPFALRPNAAAFSATSGTLDFLTYAVDPTKSFGPNVDYVAPDVQHMFLAMQLPDGLSAQGLAPGTVVIPSYHRPELVRYWANKLNITTSFSDPTQFGQYVRTMSSSQAALLRKIVLRPLPGDHPAFTGSNKKYDPTQPGYNSGFNPLWNPADGVGNDRFGWDVDNDNDGIPDAVWLDLGFPVQASPDGRTFKPLFAITVLDLDGRLNVNAHGNLAQASTSYSNVINMTSTNIPSVLFAGSQGANYAPVAQATLPHGQGFGPAEVNLAPLFNNVQSSADATSCQSFLCSRYADYNSQVSSAPWWTTIPGPGQTTSPGQVLPAAGQTNVDDPLSQNKSYDYWSNGVASLLNSYGFSFAPNYTYNWWTAPPLNAYGMPVDRAALGAIALDPFGRPVFAQMGYQGDYIDDPYEIDLSGKLGATNPDQPYTASELDAVLRPFDGSSISSDSQRLASVGPVNGVGYATFQSSGDPTGTHRLKITTDSWDLPCPGITVNESVLNRLYNNGTVLAELQNQGWFPPQHVRDLLAIKMYLDLRTQGTPVASAAAVTLVRQNMARLLSYDMLAGRKMDLNRLFGIGQDTLGNNVPDTTAYVTHDVSGNLNFFPANCAYAGGTYPASLTNKVYLGGLLNGNVTTPLVDLNGNLISGIPFLPTNGVDVIGDGNPNDQYNQAMARQLYARYLYILGLLAIDHQVANPASPTQQEADRARLVAQWAVNVVDFRDRDSIMTPFEYDIAPFADKVGAGSTWNVDGVIDDVSNPPAGSDDKKPWRGLVWGCERPELLITETLAFHDRRTTINTQNNPNTWQQQYPPEGSLFIELYNAASSLDTKTGELYSAPGGGIVLDKLDAATGTTPVWRLAVYTADYNYASDYNANLATPPANDTNDPDNPYPANPSSSAKPERTVYFTNPTNSPLPAANDGHRHFSSLGVNATNGLQPGRYAVIGPALQNVLIASPTQATGNPPFVTYIGMTSSQQFDPANSRQIVLDPSQNNTNPPVSSSPSLKVLNNSQAGGNDLPFAKNQLQTPVAIVIDQGIVNGTPQAQRLSVSEPFNGYPVVTDTVNNQYSTPFSAPLDQSATGALHGPASNPDLWTATPVIPLNGTTAPGKFRFVYLQRLANPLLPWDATRNPYRTVDSMAIDLTTFNGATSATIPHDTSEGNPAPIPAGTPGKSFNARERGENNGIANGPFNNPWTQEDFTKNTNGHGTTDPNVPSSELTGQVFNDPLDHSLGYLNWFLNQGTDSQGNNLAPLGPRDNTYGSLYTGGPRGQPFPWITWNNRPFVNEMELLMVPTLGAKELLANPSRYSTGTAPPGVTPSTVYPFQKAFGISSTTPNPYANPNDSFPHLMNLFLQPPTAPATPQTAAPPFLHRLLDFVYVPSRFVDVETQVPPLSQTYSGLTAPYAAPFQLIPDYREPGRVNINTIMSPDVLTGLLNYYPGIADSASSTNLATVWKKLIESRQGFTGASGLINPSFSSRFCRPFRSSGGTWLVPPTSGESGTSGLASEPEVNRSLLRQDPEQAGRPFLAFDQTGALNSTSNVGEANQPDRNAYFRYNVLQKLGSTVSTRSNVYAVWITEGYFEVQPVPPPMNAAQQQQWPLIYPDGYTVGQEFGIETASTVRHRAFYIIDRSVPVGFQRGQNNNVDNANTVRTRSYIQ